MSEPNHRPLKPRVGGSMPLSPEGSRILTKMIKQYGEKKGKQVFYSKENKDRGFERIVKK